LHPGLCGEFAGALGFAFEAVDWLPVFVAIVISELAGEVFRVRNLAAVELPGGAGGADERADDALQVARILAWVPIISSVVSRISL
jgi:hypothetical protein